MATPVQYTLVQTVNPAASTGSITATPTNTLVGSLILVFIAIDGTVDTLSTISDNAGNTYTQAYTSATNGLCRCYYVRNSQPTNSVVVTFSGSFNNKSVIVREYGGMSRAASVLDQTKTGTGTGTAVTSGASSSTREAGELVVSSCSYGSGTITAAGSGYGNLVTRVIGSKMHAVEDQTLSSMGAQTATMTGDNVGGNYDIGLAAFVIAVGKFAGGSNNMRPAPFKPGLAR